MSDVIRTETYIDKGKRDLYTSLTEDEDSLFYKCKDTEVFVAATTVGYYHKKREPIKGTKHSLYPMSMFKSDDANLWILKSVAIAAGGIDVLRSLREVATIVEEYANAGIDILYERHHNNPESEIYSMVAELMDIIELDEIIL